jgi:ribosomal protein L37AE/L43A
MNSRRFVNYRIDTCPHCQSDEIQRVAYTSTYTLSTGRKMRRVTKQDRLYWCIACATLIDVRKRSKAAVT